MIATGQPLPNVELARLDENERIQIVTTQDLFGLGRNVLFGVPGVFTPVCTKEHVPEVIQNSTAIRSQDVNKIYCISDDNPWALNAWASGFEGHKEIDFISDGNRDLLSATGLMNQQKELFLANHYCRFFAIIENMVIKGLNIEKSVLDVTCTADLPQEAV